MSNPIAPGARVKVRTVGSPFQRDLLDQEGTVQAPDKWLLPLADDDIIVQFADGARVLSAKDLEVVETP